MGALAQPHPGARAATFLALCHLCQTLSSNRWKTQVPRPNVQILRTEATDTTARTVPAHRAQCLAPVVYARPGAWRLYRQPARRALCGLQYCGDRSFSSGACPCSVTRVCVCLYNLYNLYNLFSSATSSAVRHTGGLSSVRSRS